MSESSTLLYAIREKYPQFYAEHHFSSARLIGAGEEGQVFLVGKRVFKITRNYREAKVSERLISSGKNFKNIVKLYNVWRLGRLFIIEQEFLQPLTSIEREYVHPLAIWIYKDKTDFIKTEPTVIANEISSKINLRGKGLSLKHTLKLISDLKNGLLEFKSAGIRYGDYSEENIKKDSVDNYKFLDFGYARVT